MPTNLFKGPHNFAMHHAIMRKNITDFMKFFSLWRLSLTTLFMLCAYLVCKYRHIYFRNFSLHPRNACVNFHRIDTQTPYECFSIICTLTIACVSISYQTFICRYLTTDVKCLGYWGNEMAQMAKRDLMTYCMNYCPWNCEI